MTSKLTLALEWLKSSVLLKTAKDNEGEKRAALLAACFPVADDKPVVPRGTSALELENGYRLKVTTKAETKVLDVDKFKAAIAKLRETGEAGNLLATRLVRWEPKVSLTELEKLDPKHRALFKKSAEVKLSGASVELVEPS